MPKKTLKSLEADIATLRELRERDQIRLSNHEKHRGDLEAKNMQLREDIQALKLDRQWMKSLIQNLVLPPQERCR